MRYCHFGVSPVNYSDSDSFDCCTMGEAALGGGAMLSGTGTYITHELKTYKCTAEC